MTALETKTEKKGFPVLIRQIVKSRNAYLFIAPFFIGFLIFDAFPIVYSAYISLHKWNGLGPMEYRGFKNYVRLFQDDRFIVSLKNTAILWLGHIFILLFLAFILAVVLNSKKTFARNIHRAVVYLPNVTPIAAMALVFGLIFDSEFGILNSGLNSIGFQSVPWLIDMVWAKVSVIMLNLWNATGWYMLIFLAGLQSIDPVLYEASEVDGANTIQKVLFITLPSLRNVFFFVFIIETIGSFEMFTEPYVLTQGGPLNSTLTVSLYTYRTAFEFNKFGYSAAMSFALFIIIVIVSLIQAKLTQAGDE
jgi:ABC-type sugar transport system permease subunit